MQIIYFFLLVFIRQACSAFKEYDLIGRILVYIGLTIVILGTCLKLDERSAQASVAALIIVDTFVKMFLKKNKK